MLHAFKTLPETVQSDALLRAVAEGLYKRMAIKDEYEVARMYSSPEFKAHLHQQFETAPKLSLHLAPPIFAQKTASGDPKKKAYGAWIFPILRIMAKWRHHRNTWLDPFRNTAERKLHLQILQEYQTNLHIILQTLCPENAEIALKLAKTTMQIKGYGSVLQKNHEKYHAIEQELRRKLSTSTENRTAAE
jgi:indolepyruvate ferredoxin oxidoreductase